MRWIGHGLRACITGLLALAASGCVAFHAGPLPDEPAGATFLELEGARLRYVDEGEGAPVVMIHGFGSSLDAWDPVRPTLIAAGFRTVAVDLKGFGWSDRAAGDYSRVAQARRVLALMDARGIERAALVAHSWGSSIALTVALLAPERVSRVALYDAFVYPGQRNTYAEWAQADGMGELLSAAFYDQRLDERMALAFFDPEAVPQAVVDHVNEGVDRPGTVAAHLAALRGMDLDALTERIGEVDVPVLLLWGREDRVTALSWGERLSSELPQAELRVYPRCGHFPMVEAANPSRRHLARFLEPELGAPAVAPTAGGHAPIPVPLDDDVETPVDEPGEDAPTPFEPREGDDPEPLLDAEGT